MKGKETPMSKIQKRGKEVSYVSFQLETSTYNDFQLISAADGRSLASAVKQLMRNAVKNYGKESKT